MFAIIETPNSYAGTLNAPQEHFVRNIHLDPEQDWNAPSANNIAMFTTKDEAQTVVDKFEEGIYYTSHGEAGRPAYKIIDYDDGDDKPDCYPGTDKGDSDWEEIDPEEIPDGILKVLDEANVELRTARDDYDIYDYIAETNDYDIKYRIVFCPRTLAIERANGDLGNICWENPGYYQTI